jgi:hypothetical protein
MKTDIFACERGVCCGVMLGFGDASIEPRIIILQDTCDASVAQGWAAKEFRLGMIRFHFFSGAIDRAFRG